MSYDLEVWIHDSSAVADTLAALGFTALSDREFETSGRNWMIGVSLDAVEEEDIPDRVYSTLAGITHLVSLSLNPIGAPWAGRRLLKKAARALAEAGRGVAHDPQADRLTLSAAAKADATAPFPANRAGRVDLLCLSWWWEHDTFTDPGGVFALLDTVARHLPEALPRRYGPHEPPEHRLERTGRAHLEAFLLGEEDFAVFYPTPPCLAATYPMASAERGWDGEGDRRQFRAAELSFSFDAAVLESPAWRERLIRAWRALSLRVAPFYGDVRVLSNWEMGRSSLYFLPDVSETHPASGPFWRGIPREPALARVLGPTYSALWPDVLGERAGELVHLGGNDWTQPLDPSVPDALTPPEPPTGLDRLDRGEWRYRYPDGFPF